MSDVGTQLRSYFDEVVERMTEEDVRIRATTDHGIPVPTPRFRLRPAVAATLGFGLTLLFVGVVLVLDRALGSGVGDAASGGRRPTTPGGGLESLWPFVPVAAGAGLLATGILWRRRHSRVTRSQKGETMQTIEEVEATEVDRDQTIQLRKRNRWLGYLAGILAVAVVGLGAWIVFDSDSTADLTPAQEQMIETLDASLVAWNSGDGVAAEALMAPSGYHDNGIDRYYANGELAALIDFAHVTGFSVSTTDRVFIGDFVIATSHIPADSTDVRVSMFKMSPDGTQILWHFTPDP